VPIVLIANNVYNPRFSTLRRYCLVVELKKPYSSQVIKYLRKICLLEGIEAEEKILRFIVGKNDREIRSVLNDLQALTQGKKSLTYEDVSWFAERDRKEVIFKVLKAIFYSKDIENAKKAVDVTDVKPDMIFEWVYENIPYQIKNPKELFLAMNMLSRADIYRKRIRNTQKWSLFYYFLILMTAGVATSWNKKSSGWIPFRFPKRIGFLSTTKKERYVLLNIGLKISKRCHISSKRGLKEILPYIKIIFQNNNELGLRIIKWLKIDKQMETYITKN
jgi:hypothetical protein